MTAAQRRVLNLLRAGRRLIVERHEHAHDDHDVVVRRAYLYSLRGQISRVQWRTVDVLLERGALQKIRGFNGNIEQFGVKRRREESST